MKNKEAYFKQIYEENKDMVYRLCLGYLGRNHEVEDLFQDIFLKIWQHLESFKGDAKISTWIYRIATNTALQFRKKAVQQAAKQTRFEEKTNTLSSLPVDNHSNGIAKNEQLGLLLSVISKLNGIDKIVITLALEGFSYKEISEITGLKVNHIGVKINRIKQQLKKMISHHGRSE